VDALAAKMTSRDLLRWRAYFQVVGELEMEAAGLPVPGAVPSAATVPPADFQEFDERQLRDFFRGHNERLKAA
jgi:hypothetical protein